MNLLKYSIILFCNKKKIKVLYQCQTRKKVYEYWHEYKTQRPPRFLQVQGGKRKQENVYELALIFPNGRWVSSVFVKDSLGRLIEATMEDKRHRIKEIIPYWKEELIYDHQKKERVRYHELFTDIMNVTEIAQVFTLNNKLFVQVEDDVKMYGNKNVTDSERLFELLREDLLKKKKTNFLFVRDVNTAQRKLLYNLLESKGFKRTELFRHYSY